MLMLALTGTVVSGCATLFADSEDEISFISDPSGADIYLNGEYIGKTPVSTRVKRQLSKTMVVVVKKQGYQTKEFYLKTALETAAIFNLSSGFSWTTDAVTGNMIEYDPKKYLITLERENKHSVSDQHWQNRKALSFVAVSFKYLKRDIASGQGEYFDTLLKILPNKNKSDEVISRDILDNRPHLLEAENPLELYARLMHVTI